MFSYVKFVLFCFVLFCFVLFHFFLCFIMFHFAHFVSILIARIFIYLRFSKMSTNGNRPESVIKYNPKCSPILNYIYLFHYILLSLPKPYLTVFNRIISQQKFLLKILQRMQKIIMMRKKNKNFRIFTRQIRLSR